MMNSVAFFAILIGLIALVVGIIAMGRSNSTLSHPTTTNPGDTTTLFSSFGTIGLLSNATGPRVHPGSTDTSGSVKGIISGPGFFQIVVGFGSPFVSEPKAVMLTAPTDLSTSNPILNYQLAVENITKNSFEVSGYSGAAVGEGVLFYYLVL